MALHDKLFDSWQTAYYTGYRVHIFDTTATTDRFSFNWPIILCSVCVRPHPQKVVSGNLWHVLEHTLSWSLTNSAQAQKAFFQFCSLTMLCVLCTPFLLSYFQFCAATCSLPWGFQHTCSSHSWSDVDYVTADSLLSVSLETTVKWYKFS